MDSKSAKRRSGRGSSRSSSAQRTSRSRSKSPGSAMGKVSMKQKIKDYLKGGLARRSIRWIVSLLITLAIFFIAQKFFKIPVYKNVISQAKAGLLALKPSYPFIGTCIAIYILLTVFRSSQQERLMNQLRFGRRTLKFIVSLAITTFIFFILQKFFKSKVLAAVIAQTKSGMALFSTTYPFVVVFILVLTIINFYRRSVANPLSVNRPRRMDDC